MRKSKSINLFQQLSIFMLLIAMCFGFFAECISKSESAHAASESDNVILRQVYGGGGKSDTPFSHSFIELFNPTSSAISLNGKSLQYMSHRGGSHAGNTNGVWVNYSFEPTAEIAANSSFLVRCAAETTSVAKITLSAANTDAFWDRVIDNNQEHAVILIDTANLITTGVTATVKAEILAEIADILSDANIIDSVYIGYSINPEGVGVSKQRPARKTDNNKSVLEGTVYQNWEQLKYNDDGIFNQSMADFKDPCYSGGYTYTGERGTPSGDGSTFVPPTENANNIPTTLFNDTLSVKKLAGAKVNPSDADGGAAEIVQYNKANGKFYVVSGAGFNQLYIGDISDLSSDSDNVELTGTKINIEPLVTANVGGGFVFGDFTSLDISPDGEYVALAIQEYDFTKQGVVFILTKNGEYVHHVKVGVQPDMLVFSKDGRKILTADEGEARDGYAAGTANPKGSVSIVDISGGIKTATVTIADFTAFDTQVAELLAANVLILDGVAPSLDFEPEYIEVNSESTFAYVSLQEANAIATLDLTTKQFVSIKSLGFVDYSATLIDAIESPEDYINLQNVSNLYGVRMPDGIAVYEVGGETYILTANEGDAREFGGRGFSIFKASDMSLVYDSGSDFEAITAQRLPDYFNISNDGLNKDARSKKKGPEPEGVTVGMVGDKMYAYVVLERIGGVMTYDITDLANVKFANYTNTRDFTGAIGTDSGPEGIAHISAEDSPTFTPLLIVAFETSGDIAVYQLGADYVKVQVSVAQPAYSGAALKHGDALPQITTTTPAAAGTIALTAGQTLTAGTKSYNWTFTPSDTKKYEYQNLTGTITLTVGKVNYSGNAPIAEVASVSKDGITMKAVSGAEYSIDNGTTWQTSNTFAGLKSGTRYSIKIRIKETDTTLASSVGSAEVSTEKGGLGGGAIAGIVIGAVVGLCGFAVYWFVIKKNRITK